jgi:hypothetical protein
VADERRKYRRLSHPFEGSWTGASGGASRCRIGDISLGGCFIQSLATPTPGEATTITFEVGSHRLSFDGTVVYNEPGMGFAVQFGAVRAEELAELGRLLEALEKGQAID